MRLSELKEHRCWVMHKNKVPRDARTGMCASVRNRDMWVTADEAWEGAKRYGADGIGYVFTLDKGVVGIDLDDCFEEGVLKSWAADVVGATDSYTEYSPSKEGLHILAKGKIDRAVKNSIGFEMYAEGRYFTVTGHGFLAWGEYLIEERHDVLRALAFTFTEERGGGGQVQDPPPQVEIGRALSFLPKRMAYDEWLSVLMAVHSVMPDEKGVGVVESWSPGKPGEVAAKFRSFKRSGISIRTLYGMAAKYGYRNRRLTPHGDLRSIL